MNILSQMQRWWESVFGLDASRSIWVSRKDLGKERVIEHGDRRYSVTIPAGIEDEVVLRLRGLGRTRGTRTGDLLLHLWADQGRDIKKTLWLSETFANTGGTKVLRFEERRLQITIPSNSAEGRIIRLRGLGRAPRFRWRTPFHRRLRGDLLVRLVVYPDRIAPRYGAFEGLNTEEMASEGWIFRKIDEIIHKMARSSFPTQPLTAEAIADTFNEVGWRGVSRALVRHLKLSDLDIKVDAAGTLSAPGNCQRTCVQQRGGSIACNYRIAIQEQFLDSPFAIAAILAHELCHVVFTERLTNKYLLGVLTRKPEQASLEEERTVDLLVFMYKIGEFQLRVARDQRLTLGYFNQEMFERTQVIVSRKLGKG